MQRGFCSILNQLPFNLNSKYNGPNKQKNITKAVYESSQYIANAVCTSIQQIGFFKPLSIILLKKVWIEGIFMFFTELKRFQSYLIFLTLLGLMIFTLWIRELNSGSHGYLPLYDICFSGYLV